MQAQDTDSGKHLHALLCISFRVEKAVWVAGVGQAVWVAGTYLFLGLGVARVVVEALTTGPLLLVH